MRNACPKRNKRRSVSVFVLIVFCWMEFHPPAVIYLDVLVTSLFSDLTLHLFHRTAVGSCRLLFSSSFPHSFIVCEKRFACAGFFFFFRSSSAYCTLTFIFFTFYVAFVSLFATLIPSQSAIRLETADAVNVIL